MSVGRRGAAVITICQALSDHHHHQTLCPFCMLPSTAISARACTLSAVLCCAPTNQPTASVPASTCARSRSPAEMCVQPYSFTMQSHCVPLPALVGLGAQVWWWWVTNWQQSGRSCHCNAERGSFCCAAQAQAEAGSAAGNGRRRADGWACARSLLAPSRVIHAPWSSQHKHKQLFIHGRGTEWCVRVRGCWDGEPTAVHKHKPPRGVRRLLPCCNQNHAIRCYNFIVLNTDGYLAQVDNRHKDMLFQQQKSERDRVGVALRSALLSFQCQGALSDRPTVHNHLN